MFPQADFVLYDRNGELCAVAEVKSKVGTTAEWAAQLRRNLLDYGAFRDVRFLLFIMPDRIYLWKDAGSEPVEVPPTFVIDAEPLFRGFFTRTGIDPAEISKNAFEMFVSHWLTKLVYWDEATEGIVGHQHPLVASGFLGAVKDGRIIDQLAA